MAHILPQLAQASSHQHIDFIPVYFFFVRSVVLQGVNTNGDDLSEARSCILSWVLLNIDIMGDSMSIHVGPAAALPWPIPPQISSLFLEIK